MIPGRRKFQDHGIFLGADTRIRLRITGTNEEQKRKGAEAIFSFFSRQGSRYIKGGYLHQWVPFRAFRFSAGKVHCLLAVKS